MKQSSPMSLDALTSMQARPPWRTDLVLPEIGGGKLDPTALTVLKQYPNATALTISGLDQRAFEALIENYGHQFTGLHLWKCPRIEDLSPLETLPQLTHVAFYWNQRATRLWDLSSTPNLSGLQLADFTRLKSLDDLANAQTIDELMIGNLVESKMVIESLEPLSTLVNMRTLEILVRKVEDGRVQPLAKLRNLRALKGATNLWTTEQCAWLRAHLPDGVQGRVFEPTVDFVEPINAGRPDRERKDFLVVGKRKPWLNSNTDAERIARYTGSYWALVERFRQDPTLDP